MRSLALRAIGHLWAAPLTVAGLVVAGLGGGRPVRIHDGAIDVVAPRSGPLALFFRAAGVNAYTWGATIVYRDRTLLGEPPLLAHERAHVRQCLLLGPLVIAAYPAASLWQLLRGGRAYRDNWFERDARRAEATQVAGQGGGQAVRGTGAHRS